MDGDPDKRRRGLELMARAYGWEKAPDVPGDFLAMTAEHLFADVWGREGLSFRDRRLLLIGVLAGLGEHDVVGLQVRAALANNELATDELREIVIFLTHYVGWARGAKLNQTVETAIGDQPRSG